MIQITKQSTEKSPEHTNNKHKISITQQQKKKKKKFQTFFIITSSLVAREGAGGGRIKRHTLNAQYILAKFDVGVPPHRIVVGLQYRDRGAILPTTSSIDIATIEKCLYDNGRFMKIHHQAAIATTTKDDDPRSLGVEVGHTSDPPPQGGACQLSTGPPAMGNLATTDYVVDSGPTTMLPWDAQADEFALTAYRARKSRDEDQDDAPKPRV